MPSPAVLTVTHLKRRVRGVDAVRDVSMSARPGEVEVLLGRNGAGKTTTVECCVGLVRGWSGEISLWGKPPGSAAVRPRVGVMLQDGALPRGVSALRAVAHVGAMYDAPLNAAALLDRLGLAGVAKTRTESLSGGELRRVAIAAAIVGQPDLVFLDEPSAGLDPHARHELWAIIRELRDAGAAIVLTTHDMAEAAELASHVTILDAGAVVSSGTVKELLKAHAALTLEDAFFAATSAPGSES